MGSQAYCAYGMLQQAMRSVLSDLYRLKLILGVIVLIALGVVAIVIGEQATAGSQPTWLGWVPWNEFGGILIGAGVLSVWLEHFLRREQDAVDEARLRHLLHEQAPAMRDAVLDAFAANHDDLQRVATPKMLDQIITNSLALRLDDAQFATEIYTDIREQAIGAAERWHDANLSIELSPAGKDHFSVLVRWEYTTVPAHAQRRFVCVSDREEYVELASERGNTSAWYLKPGHGIDASDREAFELVSFAVNGEDRPIRRSARKTSQIYSADIGQEALNASEPVTITYTYRTITRRAGHLLFFDIEQPTRDLRIDFDYAGCGIESVSTLDLVPTVTPPRIETGPAEIGSEVVRVALDGWVFPRSGFAFVWGLPSRRT